MTETKKPDSESAQKSAAESLRRQISELVKGKTPAAAPRSLRDFVDSKMAEDRESDKKDD